MPDLNALMPKAPDQNGSLLSGNPLQLLGAIGQINQARLFDQTFRARENIGKAYKNNTNPDGTINQPGLVRDIGQGGGFLAPEGVSGAISNSGAQRDLDVKNNQIVADRLGTLVTKPNVSADDVYDVALNIAKTTNIPKRAIFGMVDMALKDPAGIQAGLAKLHGLAVGAPGVAGRIQGEPTAGGEATTMPAGTALYPNQGSAKPGQVVTTLPPGAAKSAEVMQSDLTRAGNFGQDMAVWDQALGAINDLEKKHGSGYFAPGSKGRQDFQSFFYGISPTIARWGGIDPEKLKDYAKADKYLTQAVQARAQNFGAHTDQQLATTISGSPNVSVNDMAVKDVVKMSMALRRMEQVQTLENSKGGPTKYTENSSKWAASVDPRAFAIDLMAPKELEKLQKELKGAAREKFNRSLRMAIENGVITPPGQ